MLCKVLHKEQLSPTLYRISFERHGLEFHPGQHVSIGLPNEPKAREYSIASGIHDNYLAVVIREVPQGILSKRLCSIQVGETLNISKPRGHFTIESIKDSWNAIQLIATGSGIAPFLSFARSYPLIPFKVIHGIRYNVESFADTFKNTQVTYVPCISREANSFFSGRVTDYLRKQGIMWNHYYFLCGNGTMIHDTYRLLRNFKVDIERILYEEYF